MGQAATFAATSGHFLLDLVVWLFVLALLPEVLAAALAVLDFIRGLSRYDAVGSVHGRSRRRSIPRASRLVGAMLRRSSKARRRADSLIQEVEP